MENDAKRDLCIPDDISTINGELYAAISMAASDSEWNESSYSEYLALLKEKHIRQAAPDEAKKNEDSMCVEICAAADYLPSLDSEAAALKKTSDSIRAAIRELGLQDKYKEAVRNDPDITGRAEKFIALIKANIKKFFAAALLASFMVGGSLVPGRLSMVKEAEAGLVSSIATAVVKEVVSGTYVDYNDGKVSIDFDGRGTANRLGNRAEGLIYDVVNGGVTRETRKYQNKSEENQRINRASKELRNALEGLSGKQRDVALRTLALSYEMGGADQRETSILSLLANSNADAGLTKLQLQDVNQSVKEASNNYRFTGGKQYTGKDVYSAALQILRKEDSKFDRELSLLQALGQTSKLAAEAISLDQPKTANVLLGMMEKMYKGAKEFYDSSSLRKTVKETRNLVKQAAEKYTDKSTITKYNLNRIDAEPDGQAEVRNEISVADLPIDR